MNESIVTKVYSGQLARWVASYAAGRFQDLGDSLDDRSTPNDVKRFLINAFGNRVTWLMRETAALAEILDNHSALVEAYIRTVPRAPYDITGPSDEERFLRWLLDTQTLTPVQRDFATMQLGEFAVGTEGRRNRPAHLRFQELRKRAGERLARLDSDPALRVCLNPIRFASRLHSDVFAGEGRPLPADIVFFAAGTSVQAALLTPPEAVAVRELTERAPCTLADWAGDGTRRGELAILIRDLAARGLVAVASQERHSP
jgi:hypothetical protein